MNTTIELAKEQIAAALKFVADFENSENLTAHYGGHKVSGTDLGWAIAMLHGAVETLGVAYDAANEATGAYVSGTHPIEVPEFFPAETFKTPREVAAEGLKAELEKGIA